VTIVGASLAEQVVAYLRFRADGGETTRILLSGYPEEVLLDACRELVRMTRVPSRDELEVRTPRNAVRFRAALMQDASAGPLAECDGYPLGSGWDHLVGLRNLGCSLVVGVPPQLMDSCPESLKSNTFQDFQLNLKFGASHYLFRQIAEHLVEAADDTLVCAQPLGYALQVLRDLTKSYFGDGGDSSLFSRLSSVALPAPGAPLDLRTIGLLPDRRLDRRLTDGDRDKVTKLVNENFRWQMDLVSGLSRWQHKYLVDRFGSANRYPELEAYVAARRMRLEAEDPEWRASWPLDLYIDDFLAASGASRRSVRVQGLRVENALREVLRVPVVVDPPAFRWKLRSNLPELPGRLLMDHDEYLSVDVAEQKADAPELPRPGLHEVALESAEPSIQVTGDCLIRLLVPDGSVRLLATVDNFPAGADAYQVPKKTEFSIRWEPTPGGDVPDSVRLFLQSSSSSLEINTDEVQYLIPNGIDEDTEVVLQGLVGSEEPPSMRASFTVRAWAPKESRSGETTSVARGLLQAMHAVSKPAAERGAYEWEIESLPTRVEIRVWPEGDDPEDHEPHKLGYADCALLRQFERQLLDHPRNIWPRVLSSQREGRSRVWCLSEFPPEASARWAGSLDPDLVGRFVRSREAVFERVKAGESLLSGAELWDCKAEITTYLYAYLQMIRPLLEAGHAVSESSIALGLVDAVLLPRQSKAGLEAVMPSAEVSAAAVLLGPTHPLRLAWLCGYEGLVKNLLSMQEVWSAESVESLESLAFPGTVIDFSLEHYHSAGVLDGDRWSILLPERVENPDSVIPSDLARELGISTRSSATGAGAKEIAREVAHYHDLHSFKTSIRLGFVNPGSGEGLREALSLLVAGKVKSSNKLAGENSRITKYLAEMVTTDSEGERIGAAFDDYAASDDADAAFLKRVVFSRTDQPLVEASPEDTMPRHHLLFGAGVAKLAGQNVSLAAHAAPPTLRCLLIRQRRSFETEARPETITHTLVAMPESLAPADETDLAVLMHSTVFLMQSLAGATRDSQFVTWTTGRSLAASVTESAARQIDIMHGIAEWVCMMDSQIDVEYFDDAASGDRYVIEYVPRFAARAANSSGTSPSAFVVTSDPAHNVPIISAINRFLISAYGQDLDEQAAERLASAVNRISGRLLLTLVGQPSAAKGAAGMGLVQLLYDSTGLLGVSASAPDTFRLLLPVDDYDPYWGQAYRALRGPTATGDHADLLDVELSVRDDTAYIRLQVLEVKNHKRGHYPLALHESAARQVLATTRVLESLFGVGANARRADAAIQDWELSELLDFHMRRTARQLYGEDQAEMKRIGELRRRIRRLVAEGKHAASWRSPDQHVLGVVLHFNPDEQDLPLDSSRVRYSEETRVGYVPFGLNDICDLLSGSPGEWADSIAEVLSEWEKPAIVQGAAEGGGAAVSGEDVPQPEPKPVDLRPIGPSVGPAPVEPASPTPPSDPTSDTSEEMVAASRAFEGFVGNAGAVTRLTRYVAAGLMEMPHRLPVNLALTGPASTGKTTLSKRVAGVLGLPFLPTQGQALTNLDDLVAKMEAAVRSHGGHLPRVGEKMGLPVLRYPPMLVFIDEAHELKPGIREALLTLLEESDRAATTSKAVVDVADVTFILATTEWGDFASTLQSRLREIKLQPYNEAEVAQMVGNAFPQWSDAVDQRLAIAGRLVPRVALSRAGELAMACRVEGADDPELMLDTLFDEWAMDDQGITELDLRYLGVLESAGGQVGEDRLQALLNVSKNELKRNVEPYLIHKGLIRVTGGGREITRQGSAYYGRSLYRK
jgi:Holliday junction resolvasome RuvABC ATP-dependent DNA helicase subunit